MIFTFLVKLINIVKEMKDL